MTLPNFMIGVAVIIGLCLLAWCLLRATKKPEPQRSKRVPYYRPAFIKDLQELQLNGDTVDIRLISSGRTSADLFSRVRINTIEAEDGSRKRWNIHLSEGHFFYDVEKHRLEIGGTAAFAA